MDHFIGFCPFGQYNTTETHRVSIVNSGGVWWVECSCTAQGPKTDNKEQAIKRWNIAVPRGQFG